MKMKRIPMRIKAHVDGHIIVYEGVMEIQKKRKEPKPRPRKRVVVSLSKAQRDRLTREPLRHKAEREHLQRFDKHDRLTERRASHAKRLRTS